MSYSAFLLSLLAFSLVLLGHAATNSTRKPGSTVTTTKKVTTAPKKKSMCPNNTAMTDEIRMTFLNMHNTLRSRLARGLEPDKLGGFAPKAKKMLKMVYDCHVEKLAIRHAKKCVVKHSTERERQWLGENVWMSSNRRLNKIHAARGACHSWWSGLRKNGVGQENILARKRFWKIGHYTQMAWETSYRLGCAVEHCPKVTLVVCQYGPAGNVVDHLIYTKGNPCTKDVNCPGKYTCSKNEGLCVVKNYVLHFIRLYVSKSDTRVTSSNPLYASACDISGYAYSAVSPSRSNKLLEGDEWCDQHSTANLQTL